jgi:hypothetical protein
MSRSERYRRHRFPIEAVEHCVWLYFRFSLSYRNLEEMIAVRDVRVTYETVREGSVAIRMLGRSKADAVGLIMLPRSRTAVQGFVPCRRLSFAPS